MSIFEYDEKLHEETMRKIGKREGIEIGEDRMSKLNNFLIKSNRLDDLAKASNDKEYRKQLFEEFNL